MWWHAQGHHSKTQRCLQLPIPPQSHPCRRQGWSPGVPPPGWDRKTTSQQPSPATVKEARTLSAVLSMGNYVLQLKNNYSQTVQRLRDSPPPSQPQVTSHKFFPFPCPSPRFPFTPKGVGTFLDSFYSAPTTPSLPFLLTLGRKERKTQHWLVKTQVKTPVARDSDLTDLEMKLLFSRSFQVTGSRSWGQKPPGLQEGNWWYPSN